jgi:two-component sensor histidine kinase
MIRSLLLVFIGLSLVPKPRQPADNGKVNRQLEIARSYFNSKNRNEADLDSTISKLHQALVLSIMLHSAKWENTVLLALADDYERTTRSEKTRKDPLFLLGYYHQSKNIFKEAGSWQDLGDNSDDFIFEQYCYKKAEALFKSSDHQLEEISALKAVGDNYLRAGKYDSSENVLNAVLQRYQLAGYKKLYYTYDLLSTVNMLRGFPNKELFYRLATVKNMEETGDYQFARTYYHDLAINYRSLLQYGQSLTYERKAFAFEKDNFYVSIHYIVFNLLDLKKPDDALTFLRAQVKLHPPASTADIDLLNLSYGSVYAALKQYRTAEKYYILAIRSEKFEGNKDFKSSDALAKLNSVRLYKIVINFYIATGQFKKAKYYLDKIPVDVAKTLGPQYLIEFNLIQFKVDSAFGNYLAAIGHYQRYKKLNDSVYSAKNETTVQELQIQNLTNDKKQSLRVQRSESNIQNMRVQRADLQRNVTLGAVALALIIAGFSYKGYRRKQMSSLLISKKNNQLQLLLREKDWLLKEVHHRVKNNLHTVFCLLESQTQYLQGDALTAVESSQRRIYAMSLLHQRLYQSKDIQIIDMTVYLPELLTYLKDSFGSPDHIIFSKSIAAVKLSVSQAIPLALIINEAATNAIKYAFPKDRPGTLSVSLDQENLLVTLVIEDNGVGIPKDTDFKNLNSMGLELMRGLSSDLQGDIRFIMEKGTKVVVTFTLESPAVPLLKA